MIYYLLPCKAAQLEYAERKKSTFTVKPQSRQRHPQSWLWLVDQVKPHRREGSIRAIRGPVPAKLPTCLVTLNDLLGLRLVTGLTSDILSGCSLL